MLRAIGLNSLKTSTRLARHSTCRTLVTTTIRQNSQQSKTIINNEKPMRIDRELPDPRADRKKQWAGFAAFSVAMCSALAIMFNYEKTENPIISDTLYQLRKSATTKEWLGENIEFDGIIPWVYGKLNPVAGIINITFYIKGDKNQSGMIRLVADRENRRDEFLIHEWSLTVNDKKFDLLSESSSKTLNHN
ncbi:similar to Saccharomyces cerevisiae YIL157C COA1 Mitochondrial inner membrane protein required for assembly of the cytochrome c oxidase complex (complex IV) [Maudiozyma barnettii]|uniref:Similar to Saccharomyces cerevisiae YIL157C COA1 Mitochondrial inner membrane protein required for assembly of the cytochrome c oxidase complex (Complex IV) n=1 Tax=Maudiozyma barnettii TaxID=61262 RepID=A0A8H2VID3_9SACH|nr:Coa1p [Kazachstania barnettii]CAB4256241.1 similar to Saccharomyces cerevisiae YIL157C COA1 Mitochondrial inner membrane protein required for assembly of the cytochrome c oxidase complex (complex IV) [Kazachstania barnettii]CAD1784850.1 similar to Saccharomyces cerevisiae YIL157C COA1 Mitochondrial inner membrane protein required for assembly of the cytochrome c oxidase complex (complex IV) [Kazachstania barnettii]